MPHSSPPERPSPWYTDGLPFRCTECGECCTGAAGYVWVAREEAVRLATMVGLDLADFARESLRTVNGRLSLREDPTGDCVLLDPESRRCRAYAARPRQCQTYPFWTAILTTPQAWHDEAVRCPGIGGGAHVSPSEIRGFIGLRGGSSDA